ncbi:hypothetical protein LSTR_LSTR001359 [Laodelphax striatellus]|uniref:Odorant receptor n=1 Tax=Laodelphax striatellus TaxID=195883 RepID=A0A482X9S6_LAOST|nr:hypothetical protein LSTR_LSTR001359 [Laodelphax striatellus]
MRVSQAETPEEMKNSIKIDHDSHITTKYRIGIMNRKKLWHNTAENWKSIFRGIKKTEVKFVIATALVVSPHQPWLTLNLILITLAFTSMTFFLYVGAMSMYYARSDLMTFVEIAHAYSIVFAFYVLLIAHYAVSMPMTHGLYQMIDQGIFDYKTKYGEDDDNKLRDKIRFYQNVFQNVFHVAIFLILCFLGILTPFLIKFFGNKDGDLIKEINYDLPVPLWLPFETDTVLGYTLAYSFVFGEVALICVYLSSAIPFIVFCTFEINLQFRVLQRSILNLEHRALERYNFYGNMTEQRVEILREDVFYAKCVHECLRENILHHIEIIRFFNLFQDVTSTLFGVIIGVSMMVLASLSIVLSKAELFSFIFIKFAFTFFVELGIVFGYCLMGTFITDGSQLIPSALYNCPWYNLNEIHRRTLRIFQINSAVSVELKGNGLFLIDLQLFVQIVQTTYSIFNIFSSME